MQTRRASDDRDAIALGVLDADAIATVRDEAWPDPRTVDEMHDTLVTAGFITPEDVARSPEWRPWLASLASERRAAQVGGPAWPASVWVAAERLPEMIAAFPDVRVEPGIQAPPSRASVAWDCGSARAELMRGRLAMLGPVTPSAVGAPLGLTPAQASDVLIALESEGAILRGWFSPGAIEEEWCDRRLLARIHRATVQRLRAEIQPVTPADFMRFLFEWQHVSPASRLSGVEGVRTVVAQLDGFELGADAWDTQVLAARVKDYDPSMLDLLCYGGEAAWARLTEPPAVSANAILPPRPVRATPIALFLRENAMAWRGLAAGEPTRAPFVSDDGHRVLQALSQRGAQFVHEIAAAASMPADDVKTALSELVWAGVVASDGFAGLRAMWAEPPAFAARSRKTVSAGGRWSRLDGEPIDPSDREAAVERYAWALLDRYGIVCRRLLVREPFAVTWRELLKVYRRLEARGDVRGGRFVSGIPGEQFALPEAVELARQVRRTAPSGHTIVISAADPLNLHGIITSGDRVPAVGSARVSYRDGVLLVSHEDAHDVRACVG